ncbi:MAG: TRAP transporter substrate-binding protein [Rhizobiaceae bacterium]|nr:TRAP transporter substrate-binding protein [Rhizobiaceae bacterium]
MGISRRSFNTSVAAGLGATIISGLSRPSWAAETVLKFGHGFPLVHPLHVGLVAAAERIKTESGGRVEMEVYGNSQLGGDSQLLSQVRAGSIDFFTTGGLLLSTLVPVASINGMGFAFPSYDEVWKAMDGNLGALIRSEFEPVGLHVLERMWDNGYRQVSSGDREINRPDDLANFKIRVPVSPLYVSLFEAFGAVPVSMNLAEVYTALQTRVVDGQENSLVLFDSVKYAEVQKRISLTNHVWDGSWVVANGNTWKGLPDDMRKLVGDIINDEAMKQRQEVARLNSELRTKIEGQGVVFNETDPELFRAKLKDSGFYQRWAAEYGEKPWALLEESVGKLG